MRTTLPMTWAELKRSRFRNRCIGSAFCIASLGVVLIGVLRIFYDLGSNSLFNAMFNKLGLPQVAIAIITSVWWVPGIPFLWTFDYRYGPVFAFGLLCIGALFGQQAKKTSQTMRNSSQQAQEERLKHERLGYPKTGYPFHTSVTTVNAGSINASVIGAANKGNVEINSTYTNLPAIAALVNKMLTHIEELHQPPLQHMQFRTKLNAMHREVTSQTPNHTFLRTALEEVWHTLRHIAEAGTAHVLVGHWADISNELQHLLSTWSS